MINIQEAARAARDFASQLYSEAELKELRIEEIESSEDQNKWFVTLGWVEPAVKEVGGFAGLANATIEPLPRVYKVFSIDAKTGRVESMKIRGK